MVTPVTIPGEEGFQVKLVKAQHTPSRSSENPTMSDGVAEII
jgi:hypothetical protein